MDSTKIFILHPCNAPNGITYLPSRMAYTLSASLARMFVESGKAIYYDQLNPVGPTEIKGV